MNDVSKSTGEHNIENLITDSPVCDDISSNKTDRTNRNWYFYQFDITKFVLAFFIVAIHTDLFPSILYPWLRIAVPLFFMISSFLFFRRLEIVEKKQKFSVLWNYIKRNLCLYFFYFTVLFPIIILVTKRSYFDEGVLKGILLLFRGFFLGSTWGGSWFVMGLIIGTTIVFFLSYSFRKAGNLISLIIGMVLYIFCCLCQPYSFLFVGSSFIQGINSVFNPYNSFLVAIIWITLGKICAEHISKIKNIKHWWVMLIVLFVFMALLYFEFLFVRSRISIVTCDVYFALIPVCMLLMLLLIRIPINEDVKYKNYFVFIRKLSTIVFALHISLIPFINKGLRLIHINNSFTLFFTTSIICVLIGILVLCLEKKKLFFWLKYSH